MIKETERSSNLIVEVIVLRTVRLRMFTEKLPSTEFETVKFL